MATSWTKKKRLEARNLLPTHSPHQRHNQNWKVIHQGRTPWTLKKVQASFSNYNHLLSFLTYFLFWKKESRQRKNGLFPSLPWSILIITLSPAFFFKLGYISCSLSSLSSPLWSCQIFRPEGKMYLKQNTLRLSYQPICICNWKGTPLIFWLTLF